MNICVINPAEFKCYNLPYTVLYFSLVKFVFLSLKWKNFFHLQIESWKNPYPTQIKIITVEKYSDAIIYRVKSWNLHIQIKLKFYNWWKIGKQPLMKTSMDKNLWQKLQRMVSLRNVKSSLWNYTSIFWVRNFEQSYMIWYQYTQINFYVPLPFKKYPIENKFCLIKDRFKSLLLPQSHLW